MGRLIDVDNIEYYLEEGGSVVAFKADIEQMPTADIDTDSAYAEGWTAAESKYRAMMSDGDCISRQAAIDAVRDRMGKGETNIGDTFIECFEMILNALPSAQPEAKHPKWVAEDRFIKNHFSEYPHCPQCNAEVITGDCYCRICGQHIDWSEDDE